jgi:hypothetical protein
MESINGKKSGICNNGFILHIRKILEPIKEIINAGGIVTLFFLTTYRKFDTSYYKAEDFKNI